MSSKQNTLLGITGVLLLGFIAFEIYTWLRVIQVISYSSTDVTTWARISQQWALARPFFIVTLVISIAAFELFRRQAQHHARRGARIFLTNTKTEPMFAITPKMAA